MAPQKVDKLITFEVAKVKTLEGQKADKRITLQLIYIYIYIYGNLCMPDGWFGAHVFAKDKAGSGPA